MLRFFPDDDHVVVVVVVVIDDLVIAMIHIFQLFAFYFTSPKFDIKKKESEKINKK